MWHAAALDGHSEAVVGSECSGMAPYGHSLCCQLYRSKKSMPYGSKSILIRTAIVRESSKSFTLSSCEWGMVFLKEVS